MVIGSDSQITESDRGLSYPAQNAKTLKDAQRWRDLEQEALDRLFD